MNTRECAHCGAEFNATRANAAYCGPRCKRSAQYARRRASSAPTPEVASVTSATRAALQAAGKVDTAAGQVALRMAGLLDVGDERAGAAMAAWARELRAALAEATAGAASPVADPIDQLKARRAARAGA